MAEDSATSSSSSAAGNGGDDDDVPKDLYDVLGVSSTATEDEIRAAYKKSSLRWHPDKNRHQEELASVKFKEVSAAYAVLSDPATRSKYDAKGLEGLNEKDLTNVEIDLSSLGTVNSVFAAMFSRLGVLSVKTMVSTSVLESAESGKIEIRPLSFDDAPISDRVEKNSAHYYNLSVTESDIAEGFCVWVTSPSSRFKVLLFDRGAEGGSLSIRLQEDSVKETKHHVAGLFFFTFATHKVGAGPSSLRLADDPEAALFRRLDAMEKREACALSAGDHIFAVYGDNFLKSSTYVLRVLRQRDFAEVADRIQVLERELGRKREHLKAFEQTYRQAKKQYENALGRFEQEMKTVQTALAQREAEYANLKPATASARGSGDSGGLGGGLRKIFGGFGGGR